MLGTLYYHFSRFGPAGALAAARYRLTGKASLLPVTHPLATHEFFLRVGSSDAPTYEQVFLKREYEFEAQGHPQVIVDAGANIGLASILFASRYPQARILAIEPEPDNFALLTKNVMPYPNIEPIQAALWREAGEIDLIDPGMGSWAFTTRDGQLEKASTSAATLGKARALTIDQILMEHDIEAIDILKIDIEGAEQEVFETADRWIGRVRSIIVELHENLKPGSSQSFESAATHFTQRWQRGENVYVSQAGMLAAEQPG